MVWMAPKLVKHEQISAKSHVWSVGCLYIEMLTGKYPFSNFACSQVAYLIGSSTIPAVPSEVSLNERDFLQSIFKADSNLCPCIKDLLRHGIFK